MTERAETLLGRLNEVRKAIAYVKKDASVDGQYMAVTHDMVTAMVRDHLIEQGIFLVPSIAAGNDGPIMKMEQVRETRSGKPVYRFEALFAITVMAEGIDASFTMTVPAHADDMGDKAPGKAESYAVKYAILKLFNIETGENEESRTVDPVQKLLDNLKADAEDYIENGDSLAVYLLSKSVEPETWTSVFNMAADGQKRDWKRKLSDSEKEGFEVLKAIKQSLITSDDLAAKENMADLTEGGKKLLHRHLGHSESVRLANLIKGKS